MTQEFYDRIAVGDWRAAHLPRTRAALGLLESVRFEDVLDIGCGEGDVALELARRFGARAVGVDISQVMVDVCRSRGLTTERADIGCEPLPFADESFDLVYLAEVLEHLVSPDAAIRELWRVLRPGGHLLVSTPNLACLPNRLLLTLGVQPLYSEVSDERVVGRWLGAFGQGGEPVGHLRLYTRRGLVEFLRMHRFDIVRVKGASFGGIRLESVLRLVSTVPDLAMVLVVLARKTT